jgi:beta-glucosidase
VINGVDKKYKSHLSTKRKSIIIFGYGIRSENVGVCLKHYLANDTEFERHTSSSNVGERAWRELYLVPFEAVVSRSKPWSIMSSHNMINGTYASSHRELLVDVLKSQYGFDGFVVSDRGAYKETVGNANGGLDSEMPGPARTFGPKLVDAVNSGDVDVSEIDDKVCRLLAVIIKFGCMDNPKTPLRHHKTCPNIALLHSRPLSKAWFSSRMTKTFCHLAHRR